MINFAVFELNFLKEMLGILLALFLFWIFIANVSKHISHCIPDGEKRLRLACSVRKLIAYSLFAALGAFVLEVDRSFVDIFYMTELSFYAHAVLQLLWEPWTRDRHHMFLHHTITLILIISSYLESSIKFLGAAGMFLHDISDPLLELTKISNYLGRDELSQVLFSLFAVVFMGTRLWLIPRYLIYEFWLREADYPWYHLSMVCFGTLCMLNCYWTCQIFKVFKNRIFRGLLKDVREQQN